MAKWKRPEWVETGLARVEDVVLRRLGLSSDYALAVRDKFTQHAGYVIDEAFVVRVRPLYVSVAGAHWFRNSVELSHIVRAMEDVVTADAGEAREIAILPLLHAFRCRLLDMHPDDVGRERTLNGPFATFALANKLCVRVSQDAEETQRRLRAAVVGLATTNLTLFEEVKDEQVETT